MITRGLRTTDRLRGSAGKSSRGKAKEIESTPRILHDATLKAATHPTCNGYLEKSGDRYADWQ